MNQDLIYLIGEKLCKVWDFYSDGDLLPLGLRDALVLAATVHPGCAERVKIDREACDHYIATHPQSRGLNPY